MNDVTVDVVQSALVALREETPKGAEVYCLRPDEHLRQRFPVELGLPGSKFYDVPVRVCSACLADKLNEWAVKHA